VFLDDQEAILEGSGVTRRVRWVTLHEPPSIPDPRLERLVLEGARVALMSRAERFGRALDVGWEDARPFGR